MTIPSLFSSRADILAQLESMGVDSLGSTKIPTSVLEDKLNRALSLAERVPEFSDSEHPIDPSKLPAWTNTKDLGSLFPGGTNPGDLATVRAMFRGRIPTILSSVRAFSDVQRTVKEIAQNYVDGHEYSYIRDEHDRSAIHFRVLGIYELNETPLVSLAYETDNTRHLYKTNDFIDARVKAGARNIARITCTLEEQALLRHLLHLNSTRVAPGYQPRLERAEDRYTTSFLLPLAELSQAQIGRLSSNDGCHVCWAPASSGRYCTSCNMVKFCGRNCQRGDQKIHKDFDARMKGGTWTDATFVVNPVIDGKQMFTATINHSSGQLSEPSKSLDAPENVHGDNATLVKIQRPLAKPETNDENDAACMLVYDRYRTFTGHIFKKDNPELWGKAMKLMPYGSESVRVYRFAKRTGDWTLSVCLDREPFGKPVW
ncbi:hypothetical protein PENSPDRAFT_634839 [Peniophora sp. CONT]|nr:hypothetical protein PENSPDRAFT_634839 [Peniophora sp. CONT]